ncbi:MAG: FapA family protein, partial [Candidatus Cloacimonadota bacterium]|nr:FapA family protein [Candidatus Cloacimonadota bacterium]
MKISENLFRSEDEFIELSISEDKQIAFISISKIEKPIDEKKIVALIEEANISYGFKNLPDNQNLAYDSKFIIAQGNKTIFPNVEFDILFDNEKSSILPNAYHLNDLKKLDFVGKDESLAHFFITKEGTCSKNIFGEEGDIVKNSSNAVIDYLGENVYFDKDKSKILATTAGYPYLSDEKKVNIISDFEINTDIDRDFEDFYLKGNLTVIGNIKDKIAIKIAGNLKVIGDIDDAHINVNGDIAVEGNIRNCQSAGISATGKIDFISADNSKIISGDTITFEDRCQFCKLTANTEISGNEETSVFMGGIIQCGGNINVAVIGSSSTTSTEVEVTVSPYIKEKMMRLTRKINKLKEDVNTEDEYISQLLEKLDDFEVA